MTRRKLFLSGMFASLILVGCAAPGPSRDPGAGTISAGTQSRTLVMVDRHEPADLHQKIQAQATTANTKRIFNAFLAIDDKVGNPQPYLAEQLPELNTSSWTVAADGSMETTYTLRPGLTWHDDAPLTAEDFVFGFRVYSNRQLGVFSASPQDQVESMTAVDPRTLLIRWRSPYPEAGNLAANTLDPLPKHLLEPLYLAVEQDSTARDTFLNHPFWTSQYVGVGPFRLVRWDRGIEIEGQAFAGHALGKPKIDRVIYRYIEDENTVLANVLAGEVQYAGSTTLRFDQAQILRRDWVPAGRGTVLNMATSLVYPCVQFRPEYQKTPLLLDLRVRQAMAHSIDKDTIIQAVYGGEGNPAYTLVSQQEAVFAEVDKALAKYPYDLRRAEQLMREVGLLKGADGFFADASGTHFAPDFQVLQSVDYERVGDVVTDTWRRAAIDVQYSVFPNNQINDNAARNQYAGIATPGAGAGSAKSAFNAFVTSSAGTAANRWSGSNRGGWSNAEFDRLFKGFNATLDSRERDRIVVQAMKLVSEELPTFPLYYNVYPLAVANPLKGPDVGASGSTVYWNLHEWTFQ